MTRRPWSGTKPPVKPLPPAPNIAGVDPIATGLQQLFAPLVAEPIPDEFMALLDQIDAKARESNAAAGPESETGK